jgi:trans-aconitate 2-methyltransferase
MKRIPEPELMVDPAQALAYAEADFSESDAGFVRRFTELFDQEVKGEIVDLGCGPGNITFRMAEAYPGCTVLGIDGSRVMLDIARERLADRPDCAGHVRFVELTLPSAAITRGSAAAVVSNSLLHHLHDPQVLWCTARDVAAPGAAIYITDLRRPADSLAACEIVDTYAGSAPDVLQEDFFNSLLASFKVEEVEAQLAAAGLSHLKVTALADRYLEISGRMPGTESAI